MGVRDGWVRRSAGLRGGGAAGGGRGCSRLESAGIGMGWHLNGARSPRAPWGIGDTNNKS